MSDPYLVQLEYYIGKVCPYCKTREPKGHEDNGWRGRQRAYLCKNCREQWDAENYDPEEDKA